MLSQGLGYACIPSHITSRTPDELQISYEAGLQATCGEKQLANLSFALSQKVHLTSVSIE